jgi:hypothetical protein
MSAPNDCSAETSQEFDLDGTEPLVNGHWIALPNLVDAGQHIGPEMGEVRMPFGSQVTAATQLARQALQLAHEYENAGRSVDYARSLGAAFEFACRALAVSWGDPRSSRRRLAEFIRDCANDQVSAAELGIIELIWNQDDQIVPLPGFIDVVEAIMEQLLQLASQGPPDGWNPPTYHALTWDQLTEIEQGFLLQMLTVAKFYGGSDTRVYLHGSRAKGQATANSDYDILAIFPNEVQNIWPPQAMGNMTKVANRQDVGVSVYWFYQRVWDDSTTVDDPTFIEQVKRYGIEVPGSGS